MRYDKYLIAAVPEFISNAKQKLGVIVSMDSRDILSKNNPNIIFTFFLGKYEK